MGDYRLHHTSLSPALRLLLPVVDRSGVANQEYHGVYGEDVEAALRFLFNAMTAKSVEDFLFQGRPRMLYMDGGPIAKSLVFNVEAAIHAEKLLALVGLVGCGKTTTLHRLVETLKGEKNILVSQALAVDKHRVNLSTLMTAGLLV